MLERQTGRVFCCTHDFSEIFYSVVLFNFEAYLGGNFETKYGNIPSEMVTTLHSTELAVSEAVC